MIKLLDCTLRDGGYVNSWRFGQERMKGIIKGLIDASIDFIEIGFLKSNAFDPDLALFGTERKLSKIIPTDSHGTLFAGMIAVDNIEIDPADLPLAGESALDLIRITFHGGTAEVEKAIAIGQQLMDRGYRVSMQPVGTSGYSDVVLLDLVRKINELAPYAFYIVDTLGELYKRDINRLLYFFHHNLDSEIAIGFHSHNNLQLALANASEVVEFAAQEPTRDFLLDATVYGMGRGAGNLHTEAIAVFLNRTRDANYHILPLLQLIDEHLLPIYAQTPWGYSTAYFLAAIKHCHPNYATDLMSRQTLRVSDIGKILDRLPNDKRLVHDRTLSERVYLEYQSARIDDSGALGLLRGRVSGKPVIVVAPGRSLNEHADDIAAQRELLGALVVTVNFVPAPMSRLATRVGPDYVFVSNRKRLAALDHLPAERTILTSNMDDQRFDVGFIVNYDDLLDGPTQISDNAGLMCVRLMQRLGAAKILLAGFDGFGTSYFDEILELHDEIESSSSEKANRLFALEIQKLRDRIETVFLTESSYEKTPPEKDQP